MAKHPDDDGIFQQRLDLVGRSSLFLARAIENGRAGRVRQNCPSRRRCAKAS